MPDAQKTARYKYYPGQKNQIFKIYILTIFVEIQFLISGHDTDLFKTVGMTFQKKKKKNREFNYNVSLYGLIFHAYRYLFPYEDNQVFDR